MFATGFQSFAFQTAGTGGTAVVDNGLLGGKAYSYHSPYSKYKKEQEELARKRDDAERLDHKIAVVEKKREETQELLKANRQKKAAKELAALEAKLQEEINVLRIERVRLIRLIQDEEAILLLLLALSFH